MVNDPGRKKLSPCTIERTKMLAAGVEMAFQKEVNAHASVEKRESEEHTL